MAFGDQIYRQTKIINMLGEPESLIFMLLMDVKIGNTLPNCISQQAKRLKLLMAVLHDITH